MTARVPASTCTFQEIKGLEAKRPSCPETVSYIVFPEDHQVTSVDNSLVSECHITPTSANGADERAFPTPFTLSTILPQIVML
jgi:hypothetical protein